MKAGATYCVYILRCKDNTLYTGITIDPARRLREHQTGKGGNYTRVHVGVKMEHIEHVLTRGMALRREAEIKKFSRAKKLELIKTTKIK